MARYVCPTDGCDYTTVDPSALIDHRRNTHGITATPANPTAPDHHFTPTPVDPSPAAPAGTPGTSPAWVIGITAAAALTVIAAATWHLLLRSDDPHTITGTVSIVDLDANYSAGGTCSGKGGYSDLRIGAQVTVRNQDQRTVATGRVSSSASHDLLCELAFTVDGVPRSDFYEVEVSHRGGLTYSHDEMVDNDWTVDLSIG